MSANDASDFSHRLLLISPFYYPDPISTGKVNTSLGRELVAEGYEVDVICSHPLYPTWRPTFTQGALPGHRFHRGGAWLNYTNHALIRRIVLELWFFFHCAITLPKFAAKVSICVMIYPPSLYGLIVHALLPRHVRRVAIVHDLQGEYSRHGYHRGFKLLTTLIHAVEKYCLSRSTRCIFFSAEMAAIAQSAYRLRPGQVGVQYPFVTMNPLTQDAVAVASASQLDEILPDGIQHIVYSGALGEKQHPQRLAAFMAVAAQSLPNVRFHILSQGPIFDALRSEWQGTSAIHFHDLVAEDQIPDLYRRSDVQIIPQAPGTEGGSLPSKLPNLLAMGVHILAVCSPHSEVATLLTTLSTGTVVSQWTEESFLAGVRAALSDAASVSQSTRQQRAAEFLQKCDVQSLAKLVLE